MNNTHRAERAPYTKNLPIAGTADPLQLVVQAAEKVDKMVSTVGAVELKSAELSARLQDIEQKLASSVAGPESGLPDSSAGMIYRAFHDDQRFAECARGANSTGRIALKGGIKTLRKSIIVGDTLGSSSDGGVGVPPTRDAEQIYGVAQRALSILDVLPHREVASNAYEYTRRVQVVGGAGYQATEGATKPETTYEYELVSETIATVAHWTRASSQVLDDFGALSAHLSTQLVREALEKLEYEILRGAGGTGQITGLIEQALPFIPPYIDSSVETSDHVGSAIAYLSAVGWSPSLIVLHPLTWFALRSARGIDLHFIAGSWAAPAPPSMWNVPVVQSSSMPQGQGLVMDTSQVMLLDRMAPVLMASRFDGDNLTRNLVTMLAELRAGLAVYAPEALLLVDLLDESSSSSS